jgi:hypothetical protein
MRRWTLVAMVALLVTVAPRAQESPNETARRANFDQVLDTYVRDGFVYYRALKLERAKLDAYIREMAAADIARFSKDEQKAFWLNAYNALVLRTVIDRYPIPQRSSEYPQHSIRQIPGAFERTTHVVGGRTLTLDQIEQTVIPTFGDPRMYFALGRGAVGGGRLRSEAFAPNTVEAQLADVAAECGSRAACIRADLPADRLSASAIFSWREKDFVDAYASKAPAVYSTRSPVERAILAFVEPKLLSAERTFLARNMFQLVYAPFDWSLNDLTGRGGR